MIISATTPDETRKAIVTMIEELASYHRRQATMANRKTVARNRLDLAANLDTIAATLTAADIKP